MVSEGLLALVNPSSPTLWFLPPDKDGVYRERDRGYELKFTKDAKGAVTEFCLEVRTREYKFRRDGS